MPSCLGTPQGDGRAQLHQLRLAADRRQVRGSYGALHRGEECDRALRARGDDVQDFGGHAVLLHAAGPVTGDAVALVVNGFVRDVLQKLPMEFMAETQKLIGISLEGSVG